MVQLLRRAPLLLAAGLGACAEPPAVSEKSQAIVAGTVDVGDPAVVAITYLNTAFCSGTLVAPRVVVTAAHCIDPTITGGIPPSNMDVFFGTDSTMSGTSIHVVQGKMHPAWNATTLDNDIAVLELVSPAPVDPALMNHEPIVDADIGKQIRLVGFGVTSATSMESGIKRQAPSIMTNYDATTLSYGGTPGQTCFGDSGGPGFMTLTDGVEVLVGVTSAGDEQCLFFGIDTRVDAFVDSFIQPFIDSVDPSDCGADGVCVGGCSPPDPDCANPCNVNGVCDPDCTPRDPDCFCQADGVCDLGCTPQDADCTGDIPFGEPCGNNRECVTGVCIWAVDDTSFRYCSKSCMNDGDCSTGIAGVQTSCIPTVDPTLDVCAYPAPSPRTVGWQCQSGADCWSGVCVPWENGAVCSRGCLAELGGDCPLGYTCQEAAVGSETQHVCLPAPPLSGWCSAAPGRGRTGAGTAVLLCALGAMLAAILRRNHGEAKAHRHPHRRR